MSLRLFVHTHGQSFKSLLSLPSGITFTAALKLFQSQIIYLQNTLRLCYNGACGNFNTIIRGVAQFGSALGSGPRGRRFKSCRLDQPDTNFDTFAITIGVRFLVFAAEL